MKLIERLEKDERVRVAALVGETFKIDPLMILRSDHFDYCLRVAAHSIVMTERAKAQEQARRKR